MPARALLCLCFLTAWSAAHSQRVFHLEPVVVTASRTDSTLVRTAGETYSMDRGRIQDAPANGAVDLFAYIGGCDMARRGSGGIQADFSIRGSSFEQVLVLLDGVRMNNPQTGHHNAAFPLTARQVNRVDVLAGNGSSLYGSGSFGGVVRLLSRRQDENRFDLELQTGTHRTFWGSASEAFCIGRLSGSVEVSKQRSDGYRFDTDYDAEAFAFQSSLRWNGGRVRGSFRRAKRDFGANGFYADFPSREGTRLAHGCMEFETRLGSKANMLSRVFVNRFHDDFLLDVREPDGYHNRHATTVSGAAIEMNGGPGQWTGGLEILSEAMNSSRLGNESRVTSSVWNETVFSVSERVRCTTGGRLEFYGDRGVQFNPSIGASCRLSRTWYYKASLGRAFRLPTFTELYYRDPANVGDPFLEPERGWCGETGLVWRRKSGRFETTVFLRDERGRIDWIKDSDLDPWRAVNLPFNTVTGLSLSFEKSFGEGIALSGALTEIRASAWTETRSKYLSNALRRQANLSASVAWSACLRQGLFLVFKKRRNAVPYALLDSKIAWSLKDVTLFVSGLNLLDSRAEDFPGVPLPGRECMAGCAVAMGDR